MPKKQVNSIKQSYDYRKRRKRVLQNSPEAFRPNNRVKKILEGLKECEINKSKLINDAIILLFEYRLEPQKIMIQLKKKFPLDWKHINRKKFYPGGKYD